MAFDRDHGVFPIDMALVHIASGVRVDIGDDLEAALFAQVPQR